MNNLLWLKYEFRCGWDHNCEYLLFYSIKSKKFDFIINFRQSFYMWSLKQNCAYDWPCDWTAGAFNWWSIRFTQWYLNGIFLVLAICMLYLFSFQIYSDDSLFIEKFFLRQNRLNLHFKLCSVFVCIFFVKIIIFLISKESKTVI